MEVTGKVVTLKDLHNMAGAGTASGTTSVEEVADFLKKQPGEFHICRLQNIAGFSHTPISPQGF